MSKGSHQTQQQLLKMLRRQCQQHLTDAFDKFQPISAARLTALAENAPSNRLQTLYLDTQRQLRLYSAEIERRAIDSALKPLWLSDFVQSDLAMDISDRTAEFMGSGDSAEPNSADKNAKPKGRSQRGAGDSLTLLEHDDLEVMIALDNSSSSVREALGSELYELEGRFKSLFINRANSVSAVPMSPDTLLEAFANALDDDLIALEVQLELVKIFAEVCFDQSYGEMLCLVIDQLAEAGFELVESAGTDQSSQRPSAASEKSQVISAEANRGSSKTADDSEPQLSDRQLGANPDLINSKQSLQAQGVEEQASAYEDKPLIANTRIQTELLAKISSMLENAEENAEADARLKISSQSSVSGRATSSQTATRPPCMDKPQLFAEINKHINHLVRHHSELASNGQITRDLAAAIKQLGTDGRSGQGERDGQDEKGKNDKEHGEDRACGRLHRNDASVFQVVENTFASFGESMVVAPEVRQVINRCEIPMLKLALQKPVLFEQENHPIRRLFNEMAKYAIGLEQGDCEDNKIYQQMLKLAETMSADSFEERNLPLMLSEFMSIIDRDKRVTSLSEKHEIERVAAREKVNWARTRVEEEVAKRMLGKTMLRGLLIFFSAAGVWCFIWRISKRAKLAATGRWRLSCWITCSIWPVARPVKKTLNIAES